VQEVTFLGATCTARVRIGTLTLTALLRPAEAAGLVPGAEVMLSLSPDALWALPPPSDAAPTR
jgi:hypothetical protein